MRSLNLLAVSVCLNDITAKMIDDALGGKKVVGKYQPTHKSLCGDDSAHDEYGKEMGMDK